MLQGEGVRGPIQVVSGGNVPVEVGPNDTTVDVSVNNDAKTETHDVASGKTAQIPVPPVPGGSVLVITVGRGDRRRTILVEVISTM
jgi:hypothetical protein